MTGTGRGTGAGLGPGLLLRLAGIAAVVVAAVAWIAVAPDEAAARRAVPFDDPGRRFFAEGPMFAVECGYVGSSPVDPIVYPGQYGASHRHDFFGSTAVDADTTGADIEGSDTTCRVSGDSASYWAPSLFRDGEPVEPIGLTAYYRVAPGVDPEDVQPFPLGLKVVAGDAGADEPQPTEVVGWACGRGSTLTPEPQACPSTAPLEVRVTFPDCWNGEDLDSADHRSHMAYSGPEGCEGEHDVPLPRLTLVIRYPVFGDPSGLRLASGDPITAHADFMNGWSREALAREVRSCLQREVVCGIPDTTRTAYPEGVPTGYPEEHLDAAPAA